jgi:lipoate-protein ligase A
MPTSVEPADTAVRLLGVERDEPAALLEHGLCLLDDLADVPVPALRWYTPLRPALVLGRGQAEPAAAGALPVVRRGSGGGAVLMDADLLSLDVLIPAAHPLLGGDLGDVFVAVGRAWAAALADLGLPAAQVHETAGTARRLGNERERFLAGVCYATPGRGEVLVDGRKLVGLAQRRRRAGALVQCGMLWRWQPAPLLAALGADTGDEQVLGAAVGLTDLLSPAPSEGEVVAAVERRMRDVLAGV